MAAPPLNQPQRWSFNQAYAYARPSNKHLYPAHCPQPYLAKPTAAISRLRSAIDRLSHWPGCRLLTNLALPPSVILSHRRELQWRRVPHYITYYKEQRTEAERNLAATLIYVGPRPLCSEREAPCRAEIKYANEGREFVWGGRDNFILNEFSVIISEESVEL
eukprot:scaffold46248_cov42-Cyclotella_meneghiniana.AAC.2